MGRLFLLWLLVSVEFSLSTEYRSMWRVFLLWLLDSVEFYFVYGVSEDEEVFSLGSVAP